MLPVAKVLLVTVLVGGGAVGTYALAGGKFGPGGNGTGNEERAQTSTTESTTPSTDGQKQPRIEEATPPSEEPPAAPQNEVALEVRSQSGDASVTLAGAVREEAPDSADSSPSPKAGAEKETISVEGQQKDSQEEESSSGDVQAREGSETPEISGGDTAGAETNPVGGSNEPGTDSNGKAKDEVQVEQQNSGTEDGGGAKGNSASQSDQVAGKTPEPNAGQDGGQSDAGPAQDKGGASGVNQA